MPKSFVILGLTLLLGPLRAAPALAPEPARAEPEWVPLPCALPEIPEGARILGAGDDAAPMERMVLVLRAAPAAREGLARFLDDLQDSASPSWHRWLSPAQFGERFGAAPDQLAQVTGWLRDQGFTIDEVPQGRLAVVFSGDAGKVQRAFRTAAVRFEAEGAVRQAVTVPPSLPAALAPSVEGLLSLTPVLRRPMNTGFRPVPRKLSLFGLHFLAPGDFATIYNTRPLRDRNLDGSGVGIAVIGRTHISEWNPKVFRWLYGLPSHPPAIVVNGPDPGSAGSDEDGEANLDVEWSGAVAPGADIQLVVSKSTGTTDGVDLSCQYAVDHDLAPVLTVSFGACEQDLGSAGVAFYRNLWAQAAAQGITVVVASGDSGAAGCARAGVFSGPAPGVNALASTPSNVAVGGTQFTDGSSAYWRWWPHLDLSSARSYIPEAAWNESGNLMVGLGIAATGGGPSTVHPKPAWQAAPGVPGDGKRDLPDLSLAASQANGYLVQTGGLPNVVGGTSCGAPAFAGIMALLVQQTGQRQGNPNPRLYQLATAQLGGAGPQVFHDVLQGNNTVPGTDGFPCTTGYDLATGLGSLDAAALVDAWSGAGNGG